jgi:hypothetical protein
MAKALRNERFILPLVTWEKKQLERQAREANLNTSDYVRGKLGLAKARKRRNAKEEELENPEGDAENAVDVEELAKAIYRDGTLAGSVEHPERFISLAEARREAKRRLQETT